ncbi:MAG: group 1 truncated hemoglobin [Acetobacteraceae bacterium]|nr:group 1 truncated hemoglobin [Acetobacteraceae bacterium]
MRASWIALPAALLGIALATPARAADTLYAQLGEQAGIARIVDEAVALYLSDPRIKDDFDNINPDHLRTRITSFICQLAGGPCEYKGRSMAASHKGLHLRQAEFNAVAEDLQTAMEQAGVPYWTQNRLMARLAPMERDIVTR